MEERTRNACVCMKHLLEGVTFLVAGTYLFSGCNEDVSLSWIDCSHNLAIRRLSI